MTAVSTQALVNILAVRTISRVASETRAVVAAFGVITGSFGMARFIQRAFVDISTVCAVARVTSTAHTCIRPNSV